jgi:predicted Zn-dependent protease
MPGGKVVIYSGIMPIAAGENGLAVIMGHEIAHAIARHGNERMSQQLLAQAGGVTLSVLMSQKPQQAQELFNTAYGVGSTLTVLKYSRTHESEADEMGLYFMAMAGYNPNEAIGFWQRMAAKGGQKPPEFLSTHPSDDTRISQLKGWMPKAQALYSN